MSSAFQSERSFVTVCIDFLTCHHRYTHVDVVRNTFFIRFHSLKKDLRDGSFD